MILSWVSHSYYTYYMKSYENELVWTELDFTR